MARKYLVAVPKGGCGKTTTVQTLGMALAERGRRVLFVDTDPQGNLSSILGFQHTSGTPTLYTALREFTMNRKNVLPAAIFPMHGGVDLVPANMLLNRANDELASQMKREYILKRLLEAVENNYDDILIDTLPYLGVLVNNALVAADEIIIPVQAEPLGIASAAMMLSHLQLARDMNMVSNLVVRGALMTMVDRRTSMNTQAIEYAHATLGKHVPFFQTEIERTILFPESQMFKRTVLSYKTRHKAAQGYRALCDEVLSGVVGTSIESLNVPENFTEEILLMTKEQETYA